MKKLLVLTALLVVLAPMAEAQHDLSTWFKVRDGKTTVIPWYVYATDKIFIDARYNFDAGDSTAVFIGKPFGDEVKIIPAIGGIVGDYNSLSAEVNVIGKLGPFEYFTLNQYSCGFGDSPDFVYHWVDVLIPLGKNVLVGFDEQWYYQKGGKGELDYGPVVKLKTNDGLYLKGWLAATNTGAHKFFLGFGLTK